MTDLMRAEFGIRQLHARYCDAVWRKDLDLFGDCLTEDCDWRISGRVLHGRQAVREFMAYVFPLFQRVLLTLRTPIVHAEGNFVCARTYFTGQSIKANGDALLAIGTYFDRCVEEDGRWRFAWRLFQSEYEGASDMSGRINENPEWGAPPIMPPLDSVPIDHSNVIGIAKQ